MPYEEPFEEYPDGLSIAGTNGWFGDANAAYVSTNAELVAGLSAYTNTGLHFPIESATHERILCVNSSRVIANRISATNTTLFTDFL